MEKKTPHEERDDDKDKARQRRRERQREQVRKLEQKQRERDSTPVVDEPRELEAAAALRQAFNPAGDPDLPEPVDMFEDEESGGRGNADAFSKRLSSPPPRQADSVRSGGGSSARDEAQTLGNLSGDSANKNVRFEGRASPSTPPSPGRTPLSDEEESGITNAPLLPVIENQLKSSFPVKPVSAPTAPYARMPGFGGVPPPSYNGLAPSETQDLGLPSAQLPSSLTTMPPPPLPPQISQLLNSQPKLAAPGSSRPRADLFKPSSAFGLGLGSSSMLGVAGGASNAGDRKSRIGAFDDIDIADMDVASPTSDDDLIGSFTPPSFMEDREDKKSKKRHSDRKRKSGAGSGAAAAAAGAAGATSAATGSKPFGGLNVEAIARTIAGLAKDDDVPTSAVELDKQRKVSTHVCTRNFALLLFFSY